MAHSYRKHGMDLQGNRAERNYKCDQCDYATFWEHELRFHRIKHTGKYLLRVSTRLWQISF